MNTLDKIYIHRTTHLGLLAASEIDITGQDEQYLRKDALLEWLKMKTETAEIVVANSVDRWVTRQVYKQVMKKLEAM